MSSFISKDDYKYHIRTNRLDQLLEAADEDEDLILDTAESDALSVIRDAIGVKYNCDLIFAQSGDARHKTILRWAKILVIYYIYERVPDDLVPERVVKNYDYVLERLKAIEKGTANIENAPVNTILGSDGSPKVKTRRRWGSVPKRSHDGGSPASRY